jgi:gamma-glutamyltranspeptidase/glutathione hydrolase
MRSLSTLTAILILASAPTSDAGAAPPKPTPHAVAADHALAQRAGLAILDQGGNAVDAAVATSFALAVVRPESCGIGGGGFMVIHLTDDPRTPEPGDAVSVALDYRERAPEAITPTTFADLPEGASITSGLAVAVPGTVAGLLRAHELFGTLPRAAVLAPAIELARSGYTLDAHAVRAAEVLAAEITSPRTDFMARSFLARFVPKNPERPTDTRVQLPELAATLEQIAARGRDAFYTGPVAQAIVDTVTARSGVMTLEDLAPFQPVETVPLRAHAMDRTFLTMPLPSSGGVTLIQTIKTIQARRDLLANVKFGTPQHLHLVAEALKLAMADRARFLADPETTGARAEPMLDPARIQERALAIRLKTALPADDPAVLAPLPDDAGTSHLCVVDRHGNAVACTETVNLEYGSRIPVAAHGFFLNNEMDDFLTQPGRANAFGLAQAEANLPGPRKRPLSSMSPTIILDHRGDVDLVVGASGGPRIISATAQVLVAILHFRMDAQDAVDAPRLHHQWSPDTVFLEVDPPIFDDAYRGLRDRGHTAEPATSGAAVQCIARDHTNPTLWHTAVDPRKRTDPTTAPVPAPAPR